MIKNKKKTKNLARRVFRLELRNSRFIYSNDFLGADSRNVDRGRLRKRSANISLCSPRDNNTYAPLTGHYVARAEEICQI